MSGLPLGPYLFVTSYALQLGSMFIKPDWLSQSLKRKDYKDCYIIHELSIRCHSWPGLGLPGLYDRNGGGLVINGTGVK